jgi:peptidoglycan/LPS O-acetylase OafA/YrhL
MKPSNRVRSKLRSRLRDFVLYVVIALAIAAVGVFLGLSNVDQRTANLWTALVLFTAVLFGAFIAANRSLLRTRSFWVLTIVLLTLHLTVFSTLVIRVTQWRPIWSAVMFLEAPLLAYLRMKFVGPEKGRRHDPRPHPSGSN